MKVARKSCRQGFALLLAVSLLGFLTLLLVGLASYSRLETGTVGSVVRQKQARDLALAAQRIALARLQELAGPDQRVTTTAESTSDPANPHWTGVWDTTRGDSAPLGWLVSDGDAQSEKVELVGANSATAGSVIAPLQQFQVAGDNQRIGRFAWWIGDQGVKASAGAGDRLGGVSFAPYDSNETRSRLRQQLPVAGIASSAIGEAVTDSLASDNAGLMAGDDLLAFAQLAFLRRSDGSQAGPSLLREHFHEWSTDNAAVLADTTDGGLRQDLSVKPEALGAAFANWTRASAYFEDLHNPATGSIAILPSYGADPLRRRHRIVAPVTDSGAVFTTAPALVSFFIQFNVRRTGGNSAPAATNSLEVRARMVAQLWNPWTSAIVPEALRLEISGLPTLSVEDSNGGRSTVSLSQLFGAPMRVDLTPTDAAFPDDPDDHSWLPGRVYAWRSKGGSSAAWQTEFYNRTLSIPNAAIWVVPAGAAYAAPANNSVQLWETGPATELDLVLKKADGTTLWTVHTPRFAAFSTSPQKVSVNDEYRFGFPVRLVDPIDFAAAPTDGTWLTSIAIDPRATLTTEPLYRFGSGGDLPSAYVGVGGNSVLTDPNRLLDRVMGRTGMSYNEDTPVFELPRWPLLSLGELQHLQVAGQRPFSIGNSWSAGAQLNGIPALRLFDRVFFSGLNVIDPAADEVVRLPNPNLRAVTRQTRMSDLRATETAPAKNLLQHGAFNINSVNQAAWISILRSGRTALAPAPTFLNATASTGTAADGAAGSMPPATAAFYRFPQSAQETYKADGGYSASSAAPPDAPDTPSLANTHLYRRGARFLDSAQVVALANALVTLIRDRHARAGPFRSLAEFLGPDAQCENRSVLEHAIHLSGINSTIPEFSSQWLTQGDILALLAPILFARSDTFLIRAYGEALNPANGQVEARAWCESLVQRFPEYLEAERDDASIPPERLTSSLNRQFGRRFKIVYFRWLTRLDV